MQRDQSSITSVYATTAAEAAALDARTISQGTPSLELMLRAGGGAAQAIERELAALARNPLCVFTGPGNNGGDGWVIAGALARLGVTVRVVEAVEAKSEDARAARAAAIGHVELVADPIGDEAIVVDALLGTGSSGEPRGELADALRKIAAAAVRGARVVAIDLPTGLDATTGEVTGVVPADLTITFGTVKRGHLASRGCCGKIVVVDIGLSEPDPAARLPVLVTPELAYSLVPPIPPAAHKGSRGGIAIIGGGPGMAGAAVLAGRAALRSGAGSSRICVSDENVPVAHTAVPAALVASWTTVLNDPEKHLGTWPEAIAIGPGLGTDGRSPEMLDRLLATWKGPLVVDADALNLLPGRLDEFRERVLPGDAEPRAVLTPHPTEMMRLLGGDLTPGDANRRRYDVALELACRTGAIVLLKGVPTVIATPDGRRRVSATGTPALATGGAGDVLTGIIVALLPQRVTPFDAATVGAWMHGRAAELATGERTARGISIDDVVDRLRDVWVPPEMGLAAGVLAELPAVR